MALTANPEFAFGYRTLAASLGELGRLEEAKAALARAEAIEPGFNLASGGRVMITADPAMAERYLAGLRVAGLEG